MKTLIDLEGLTKTGDPYAYALELGLVTDDAVVIQPDERLDYLARLRDGRGYRVLTGPWGRDFWLLANSEVNVEVQPDGYRVEHRVDSVDEWSYVLAGVAPVTYRRWLDGKEPTPRHGQYPNYLEAAEYRASLKSTEGQRQTALVHDDYLVTVTDTIEMLGRIDSNERAAVDFEWDPDTEITFGVSHSDEATNTYLPILPSNRSAIEQAFGNRLRRGLGILHNAPADIAAAYPGSSSELVNAGNDDTMVMAYLAGEPFIGLKEVTRSRLNREPIEYTPDLATLPIAQQARYAGGDARNTYDLYVNLRERLQSTGQLDLYENVERPLMPVLSHMTRVGQRLDLTEMGRLRDEIFDMERALESHLRVYGGFDPTESEPALAGLAALIGYNVGSLDKRVLSRFRHPVVDTYIGYSNMRTLRRNYLDSYLERNTDRIHPRFNQAGLIDRDGIRNAPRSGRLSSSDPNIQQLHALLRTMFVPEHGCVLWTLDYSGMEVVIAGALSGDPVLLEYRGQLHDMFQAKVMDLTGRDIPRQAAKTANFEMLYRGGVRTLLDILRTKERIHLDRRTGLDIAKVHRETYQQYWAWGDAEIARWTKLGYSETLKGRRRYIPELSSPDPQLLDKAQRAALNHEVQGLGADIVKEVMVQAMPILEHHGAIMSMQVHDEIVGSVPECNTLRFLRDMRDLMQSKSINGVGLKVGIGVGRNWASAH